MKLRDSLADRQIWVMAVYGFASGLPLPLSAGTFRLWMSEAHVSLSAIGYIAVIHIFYSLKFLWAPLLDDLRPPVAWLGRRRGWLAVLQPLLSVACVMLALSDPTVGPVGTIAAAGCVAFLSATQDIVVDAWRIETFAPAMQGFATAVYVWAYRFAMLISGGAAIAMVGPLGWHGSLLVVALLSLLPILVTFLAAMPPSMGEVPRPGSGFLTRFVGPLREFLLRPGALLVIAFVALYRLGEAMAGQMLQSLYTALGFDRPAIALAAAPISIPALLAGFAIGGWLVARLGVGRALLMTGLGQMSAMFMYVALAASAGNHSVLYTTSFVESFTDGLATAAFLSYLSGLCSVRFAATQYALLSSLAAVASSTVATVSGRLVEYMGWVSFYTFTAFATVPSMILMVILLRRYPPAKAAA